MSNVTEIERELQLFRKKQRNNTNNNGFFSSLWPLRKRQSSSESLISAKDEKEEEISGQLEEETVETEENQPWTCFDITVLCLKIAIYVTMQIIAIQIEFGAVFFCISMLFFICTNLRSHRKRTGELSAYSVFNPGCESIQGTLSAEKLQSELTFGALHF